MSNSKAKTEAIQESVRDELPREWRPSSNPWIIAFSVMLATFMEVLDTSVANVALPHIAGNLSASTDESTWVLTSYLVSNAIILPTAGWLSKFFGRKRLLIACIAIFTLSSFACGAAMSLGMLVFARVIQGLGGGAMQPIAQAVLLESFPPVKRGMAMAAFSIGVVFAPIIGPTLGGWLTDDYSWRWVFYINIPIGLLAILMVQTFIEDPPYIKNAVVGKIDTIGFGLMAIWLATLQIMLDKGQQEDWFAAAWIRWFAIISTVSMIAFILRELRSKEPIVNLRILANRNFSVGILLMGLFGAMLYSATVMLPLFLQTLMGYTAMQSGMTMTPRGLGSLATSIIIGRLIGKVDNRFLNAMGFGIIAFSLLWLSHLNLDISMANVVWPNIANGMGMSCMFVTLTTMTMGTLRNEQMGNATSIFNLMRNIGGSVGISIMTTLLSRGAQAHQAKMVSHLTPYDPAFQQRLHALEGVLSSRVGPVAAAQQAQGLIYGTLVKQAMLWAFVDNFRVLSLLCLSCIPLVLLFKKTRMRAGPGAAH